MFTSLVATVTRGAMSADDDSQLSRTSCNTRSARGAAVVPQIDVGAHTNRVPQAAQRSGQPVEPVQQAHNHRDSLARVVLAVVPDPERLGLGYRPLRHRRGQWLVNIGCRAAQRAPKRRPRLTRPRCRRVDMTSHGPVSWSARRVARQREYGRASPSCRSVTANPTQTAYSSQAAEVRPLARRAHAQLPTRRRPRAARRPRGPPGRRRRSWCARRSNP